MSRNGPAATARPPARLTLRRATLHDAISLNFFFDAMLRKDYFLRRGQLTEILAGTHHKVFIAEIDCVLVGIAIVSGGSRLINVLVHPAYRGLGIGRALVEQTRATEVRAKLDMHGGDPRGFYRALGYRSTGRFNAKGNVEVMRLATKRDSEVRR
jgi:GNAT superfamily N-acetyltransferase